VRISAVGDVLLRYGPMAQTLKDLQAQGQTPEQVAQYPFAAVKDQLKGLVFCNLEGPLTAYETLHFKPGWMQYYFSSPPKEAGAALRAGGFKVASIANNHTYDCGARGVKGTQKALDDVGIAHVGAGNDEREARDPVRVDVDGTTVTFLAYCAVGPQGTFAGHSKAGAALASEDVMAGDVRAAVEPGQILVVSVHWGEERSNDLPLDRPSDWQRRVARRMIDEGASIVLGHHSHVVGEFEEYRHGLICYSLGNFLFAGGNFVQPRNSVILQAELEGPAVTRYDLVPVQIGAGGHPFQPQLLPKPEAQEYLKKVLFNPTTKFKPVFSNP
jgi:poly-gamma-glutamate synthesis protein (capsule biosynthesis protein)